MARDGVVLMTSRVSIELIQKAAHVGAPVLAAISAPTALALREAEAANICVCGIVRENGLEVFTHGERIVAMKIEKLIYMANQIGKFFAAQGDEAMVAGVADHLKKFWDPRMRAQILAHLDAGGAGLDAQCRRGRREIDGRRPDGPAPSRPAAPAPSADPRWYSR